MRTENIIEAVEAMKLRGLEFLEKIPDTYYDNLRTQLKDKSFEVAEDIDTL